MLDTVLECFYTFSFVHLHNCEVGVIINPILHTRKWRNIAFNDASQIAQLRRVELGFNQGCPTRVCILTHYVFLPFPHSTVISSVRQKENSPDSPGNKFIYRVLFIGLSVVDI